MLSKIKAKPKADLKLESPVTETFVFVRKNSLMEYELVEMTVEGGEVKARKVLAKDLPRIIVGKLLQGIKSKRVGE